MERKIGEIFEYKGEWYQCIPRITDGISVCGGCDLTNDMCMDDNGTKLVTCSGRYRDDCVSVIFKKLIKFGEPYINNNKTYQAYRLPMNIERLPSLHNGINLIRCDMVEIETDAMSEKAINLKSFNIDEAKAGKPVYTRDGRKVRIICFDRKGDTPIVALIEPVDGIENLQCFYNDGKCFNDSTSDIDLMMLPEKKEGWVNVYKRENEYICENECNVSIGIAVYKSEGEAKRNINKNEIYVNTIKITWEE